MRLAFLTTLYPAYLRQLYARHPGLGQRPWAEQRSTLDHDAFGWVGVWPRALAPLGYEVMEVFLNAQSLGRAWLHEQSGAQSGTGPEEIAVAQVRSFAPEVLWYEHDDEALLARLRAAVPSIRMVLGWTGSWVPEGRTWQGTDLVLSCAPESVEALRQRGVRTELLHHAFDDRVLPSIEDRPPRYDVSFIGQITLGHPLHIHRERLLDAIRREVDVTLFSPSGETGSWEQPRAHVRRAVYAGVRVLKRIGVPAGLLRVIPVVRQAATWPTTPRGSLPVGLQRALHPGRFGLEMYQTLRDSKITLNVESASTTRHSSNMRLFEATGVGACLLTDWTENLGELFEPEREVATFRDAKECVERIRWLLAHPDEREAIARAGQARTLRDHTYRDRAARLDLLLRQALTAGPTTGRG
jgi:hypothetical protein